jgi:hypothetical protein
MKKLYPPGGIAYARSVVKSCAMAILMLFATTGFAQTAAYYSFAQSQATYTPLDAPTLIAAATSASTSGMLDENVYPLNNVIPFNFTFNGQAYTSLHVHANGYVSFGTGTATSTDPVSSTGYSGIISGLGADLNTLYDIEGKTGSIAWQVTGNVPEREFVVQWNHFKPYYSTATAASHNDWNFQIRLKEDGTIRYVYNLVVVGNPSFTTVKVGLRGATSADYATRTALGTAASNWTSTTPGTSASNGISVSANYLPASGLMYTWTPPTGCQAPVAQPTSLVLTKTGIIINAGFTTASPAADRYLVLRTIAGTTPNIPVNGTTYTTGQNASLNSYVAYYGAGTSFENNYNHGIRGNNEYIYTVYAVSSNCSGGPIYRTENPLTGSITNCPATVNGITTSAVTSGGFTLGWPATENGNALPFTTILEVATNNTFTSMVPGSPFTLTSSTLSQVLTGLQPNTQYFYRAKNVSSLCESSFSSVGNVYTGCVPVTAFNEGFDDVTGSVLPNCWSKILVGSSSTPTINVTTTDASSAPNNVSFYGNGADTDAATTKIILVSPEVSNLSAGTHRLRFKARKTSTSTTPSATGLRVVALDGNTAAATATEIASFTELTTTYQEYTVYFTNYTGNGTHIGIQRFGGSSYSYMYVDDVVWEPVPSCFELHSVTASNATPNGATVSWTNVNGEAPAGGYEYSVSTTNGAPAEGATLLTTDNTTVTFNTLQGNTTYYVFVRRVCADNDKSVWSSASFTTIPTVPAPWQEEFLTNNYPLGWTTTGWTLGTVRGASGTGTTSRNLYKNLHGSALTGTFSTIAVGPLNAGNYELSFHYKQSDYYGTNQPLAQWGNFNVEVSTDFGTTWTILAIVNNEAGTGSYINKIYSLADYQGEYVQVRIAAIRTAGDFDLSFDNFEIRQPSAPAVESVNVTVENGGAAEITTANGTLQLVAGVAPATVSQEVTWSIVAGDAFASVSATGLVTALGNGTVTVRATSVQDNTKFDEIDVVINYTVVIPVESVTVSVENGAPAEITTANGTLQLIAAVAPATVSQEVAWSIVAGDAFASVSEGGLVTALANGTVTIQATSTADATVFDTITITITGQTLELGDTEKVNVSMYPNPAGATVTIQSPVTVTAVTIYNMLGQEVLTGKNDVIHIEQLQSGSYLVRIELENGAAISKKLIKK